VDTRCWTETPSVHAWLTARGFSALDGYGYFVRRAAALATSLGRRPVHWSEAYELLGRRLANQTVVHVWKTSTDVAKVVADGYAVIRNVDGGGDSWYLDHLDVTSEGAYRNDPCEGVDEDACDRLVLGGHGEMWGETADGSNLEQTVWPRLAAIAERLWSPRGHTEGKWGEAMPRLLDFRCLLLERGVAAAPVTNEMARAAPGGPGGCHV